MEYWTADEAAAFLGVTEDAARKQLSRWAIGGERRYPADQIRTAHANRPGRGARTDLQETTMTTMAGSTCL